MENEITAKRGLVLILVVATVVIFVGLVWLIATYLPWNRLGFQSPSVTATAGRAEMNCTYPVSYWREHPELYPPQMVIGRQVYGSNEIGTILSEDPQEITGLLQAQLLAAFLNNLAGADQSSIETTIFEAYGWLVKHPIGTQIADGELEIGTRLFNVLEAYNDGFSGVSLCEGVQIPTLIVTNTPTETPSVLLSITPSQTITPTPGEPPTLSETATPIQFTATATYIFIVPTRTTIPTTEPPVQVPSNTPIPPTERPSSTPTQIPPPPNTPTYTLPPPTPTFPILPTLP
jgi:hypothetical protein